MNLPKFEPLKRFFTSPITIVPLVSIKKSTSEVEVLRAQVRMLQNALSVEEEHHKHIKNILFGIIEVESIELPLPMVLEIFDYLHMDTVEDLLK